MPDFLKPLRKRLTGLDLDEISLVPAGDNPPAKVTLAKADKTHDEHEGARTLIENEPPQGATHMGDEISKDELPEDVVTYIEALEAEVERASVIEELAGMLENGDPEAGAEGEKELVLSKADPEVRSLIEKAEQRAEAAESLAKAERDLRLDREYLAKAEALPMLTEAPAELAEVLKALHTADPEVAGKVEAILATANEQIAKGNLFAEFGSSTTVEGVPDRARQAAEALTKADPTLSPEAAMVAAMEADPSLYDPTA